MSEIPNGVQVNAEGGAVLSETQAKQGRRGAHVLVVLGVSTLLAIAVLFGALLLISHGKTHGEGSSGAPAAAARTFNTPAATPKQSPD
jgi:hypothetical protein